MELLWYILLFNGDWQIGTSDGIYDMKWVDDTLVVEKEGICQWKIEKGLETKC